MGLFGSLIGWDQSMAAVNAVMGHYFIESTTPETRKKVAGGVAEIIGRVQRKPPDQILQEISKRSRVIQMNFVAMTCDNLGIAPPFPRCVWTRVKNPYHTEFQVTDDRIAAAIEVIKKDDGVLVRWPGNEPGFDFMRMYRTGAI